MKFFLVALSLMWAATCGAAESDSWIPVEKQVAEAASGPVVTVVHFWAPWCPNCRAELEKFGWRDFLSVNRDIKVIFVTVWNPEDGKDVLAKYGVGENAEEQPNFQLLHHPNGARAKDERMEKFMGQQIDWLPTTWVMKDGKIRFALNYGEVRFPLLQQLVRDAASPWDHSKDVSTKTLPK